MSRFLYWGCLLLLLVFGRTATGAEAEPNNTAETALPAAPNCTYTGYLGLQGAEVDSDDYYRLTLSTNGSLRLTVTNEATLDGTFGYTIYGGDGRTVIDNANTPLNAGDYYIRVWTDTSTAFGRYALNIEFAPSSLSGVLVPSTTNLVFDSQEIGTNATQTVSLTNTGTSAIPIGPIQAIGDFSVRNDCGASLDPGAGCTLTIRFAPLALGPRSGLVTMTMYSYDMGMAFPLLLVSGTGHVTLAPPASTILIFTQVDDPRNVSPVLVFVPEQAERNGEHKIFIAGLYDGQYYFVSRENDQPHITPYAGGDPPAYATANGAALYPDNLSSISSPEHWSIPLGDLSQLHGLQIFAGFGRNAEDMLTKGQVKLIYTVE